MTSFTQLVDAHNGELIFTSCQDDITKFLAGGDIASYEGVCLALTMMYFRQDTAKVSPLKGIKNKVDALKLQNKMHSAENWKGFSTVESEGTTIIGQKFWWKSDKMYPWEKDGIAAAKLVQHDPQNKREGMNILVIYDDTGGHALAAWRFPTGTMAFYDPNQGAGVIKAEHFPLFLKEFRDNFYKGYTGYAVCAWYRAKRE